MGSKNTIFLALIAALITNEVMAGQHVVGGSQGWDASTDFKSWVSGQTFNVGNQLGMFLTHFLNDELENFPRQAGTMPLHYCFELNINSFLNLTFPH